MLTWATLLATAGVWLSLYVVCAVAIRHILQVSPIGRRWLPDEKARALLIRQGPVYAVSFLHAAYVSPRGAQHLYRLRAAPTLLKLLAPRAGVEPAPVLPAEAAFVAEIDRVMHTNLALSGYLLADLVLMLRDFPHVGGFDMLAHHAAFLSCGAIAGFYILYPFTFGWLIIGEASTIFLNLRWLLIKANRGHTRAFQVIQTLFAVVFVITRFFIYGAGLLHHLTIVSEMPDIIPRWAVNMTTGMVICGFGLNCLWLSKIARMAFSSKKSGQPDSQSTPSTPATASAAVVAEHDKDQ